MDATENVEESLLETFCDCGQTILLIKWSVAFFPTATFVK